LAIFGICAIFFDLMLTLFSFKSHLRFYILLGIVLGCLLGCAGRQSAIYETFTAAFPDRHSAIDNAIINPKYRYLRAELSGRPALLVLGYIDAYPRGSIESWYSANQEVIQFRNGRLASTAGLDFNWTSVHYSEEIPLERALALQTESENVPVSSKLPASLPPYPGSSLQYERPKKSSTITYQRVRTLMPGYRAQITEMVFLEPLSEPPSDIPASDLGRMNLSKIRWVQERIRPLARDSSNSGLDALPAYYALDVSSVPARVVYGRQCLVVNYCLSWQIWPPLKKGS